MHHPSSLFGYPKDDAVAGIVVFLVAVPLCLGIAVACGVPPVSGRPTAIAAAASSCVLKMLHEHQRTSAPSSDSVSISTPV